MNIEAWIFVIIIGAISIGFTIAWWTEPDDLESVRQRERALEAMEKWSA